MSWGYSLTTTSSLKADFSILTNILTNAVASRGFPSQGGKGKGEGKGGREGGREGGQGRGEGKGKKVERGGGRRGEVEMGGEMQLVLNFLGLNVTRIQKCRM